MEQVQPLKRPLWTTRELLIAMVIAVVFGVVMVSSTYLYAAVLGLGIFARSAATGLFFLPAAFAAYVLRKPGAVFLVSVVSGLVAIPFTPYGLLVLGIGALTGAIGELATWIVTRYRHFSLHRLLATGALAGLIEFSSVLASSLRTTPLTPALALVAILLSVSAFVIMTFAAYAIANAVQRTGVLANTALGREMMEAQ
ncbi:MAG: ECF transporter S component [Thermoflexales bacterium]|nr:ECF transporter S component [Thermoflexales bacterium]MCS7323720.1 ECF transporter S component [Thermoflexales bacterium]MCX7938478.1 ECF transporter S component [Thermoflexales bacterium]